MMQRYARWAIAFALTITGVDAVPGDIPHVSMVPWKIIGPRDEVHAPLVLFWIPASREEVRHSELLTSDELTLYSSQCVAMRVVRFDDGPMLAKLDVEGELPAAVLADGGGHVIARVDADGGTLAVDDVEEMVREELDRRVTEADALLDDAREKADAGATDEAITLYRAVWERRCVCPRQARDAQRALKKLKAK
jgi:hypothetical protein